MKQITIPQDIGSMPFLDTVSLYQNEFGWVIHPLRGAREGGKEAQGGKISSVTGGKWQVEAEGKGKGRGQHCFGYCSKKESG